MRAHLLFGSVFSKISISRQDDGFAIGIDSGDFPATSSPSSLKSSSGPYKPQLALTQTTIE
jgi:hypothetical protein